MTTPSPVKNIEDISELEWIELSSLDGLTKVTNNSPKYYEEKINLGWVCLTPELHNSQTEQITVTTLWVKPEHWSRLHTALKRHYNKVVKDNALQNCIEAAKSADLFDGYADKNSKKDSINIIIKEEWLENLDGIDSMLTSNIYIPVNKKEVEKWVYSYQNGQELSKEKFRNEINYSTLWNSFYTFYKEKILPMWNESIVKVSEENKKPWFTWLNESLTRVYLSGEEQEKWLTSFTSFIEREQERQRRLEKDAAMIEAEKLVNFDKFENNFEIARSVKRVWTFFMGPPNTGKTYNSFEMLTACESGYYWAPLRLLALEGHETLLERGIVNDLITGEERRRSYGSTFVSSTVEMARWDKPVGAAILDEVQLMADPSRGWAWTQAILSAPTNQLILTGSEAALPYVKRMVEYLDDELRVVELKADRVLRRDKALMSWKKVKQGDAIIAFSRKDVLAWKEAAEQRGLKVSVIYGHLSPEVRREEARRFRDGETDYLIATDAIGLGLNLPIKRIVLSTLTKFDGGMERILKPSEVWQIANRAGRRGWVEEGAVTTWHDTDEAMLWQLLDSKDEPPRDLKWWVQPLPEQIKLWHEKMGGTLPQWLSFFANRLLKNHPIYKACPMTSAIERSYKLMKMELTISEQYAYATAPIDGPSESKGKSAEDEEVLLNWALRHSQGQEITWDIVKELFSEKESYHSKDAALLDAEKKLKLLTVYRWLTQKFPNVYTGNKDAVLQHGVLNAKIEDLLHDVIKKRENEGKSITKKKRRYSH